ARGDHLAAQAPACRLQLHLTADGALEVLARAQGPLRARRGDLDRVAVEVGAEHRRDPLAERVVDTAGLVDVDAEALLARQLEPQDLAPRHRARDRAGTLAVQPSLLVVRTRHHKKWAPRAHFKTAEMWCLKGSRGFRGWPYSSTIVTGPSFTSSTSIRAPKTPVSTGTPSARSALQNRS